MIVNYKEIMQDVIKFYGADLQQIIAIEEMSELQKEICKNKRGRDNIDHIAEEIADVLICIDQLQIMFDIKERVEEWKDKKARRVLKQMLEDISQQENEKC